MNQITTKKIILIFIILISIQLVYSFLFTSYPASGGCWKTIEALNFYKGYTFDSFDNAIAKKVYPLLSNYHMNCDAGGYLLLAHDFPQHYFRGHLAFLTRPLYPFLVYLISQPLHLISNSYSLTFVAGLFLNFVLFFFTVFLFYLLVKNLISSRVAFLSSVLLIFSPFAHAWLVQPETNIFGAFTVILSLYLIYNYTTHPSIKKLIIFSLLIGILILGKKFFAITFFILILAIYFKRYKEGIIFFILHLIPFFLWYLWVTQVWHFSFLVDELSFGVGVWLFDLFNRPWYEIIQKFLNPLPSFINSILYGFLLFPPIFSVIGFPYLSLKKKNIIIFGLIFSFFILFFIANLYIPRHAFLLFPIVYPLAILGMDRTADFLKKYKNWYALIFYLMIFIFLLIISNINVFKIFPYDSSLPPLNF